MILTKKQEEGLKAAVARYQAEEKYIAIAGYVSLDKTFLVEFI